MNAWECLNENEKKAVETLKCKLKERFDVREMRLFGSKVRGEAGPDSDVDIMIELAKRSPETHSLWAFCFRAFLHTSRKQAFCLSPTR